MGKYFGILIGIGIALAMPGIARASFSSGTMGNGDYIYTYSTPTTATDASGETINAKAIFDISSSGSMVVTLVNEQTGITSVGQNISSIFFTVNNCGSVLSLSSQDLSGGSGKEVSIGSGGTVTSSQDVASIPTWAIGSSGNESYIAESAIHAGCSTGTSCGGNNSGGSGSSGSSGDTSGSGSSGSGSGNSADNGGSGNGNSNNSGSGNSGSSADNGGSGGSNQHVSSGGGDSGNSGSGNSGSSADNGGSGSSGSGNSGSSADNGGSGGSNQHVSSGGGDSGNSGSGNSGSSADNGGSGSSGSGNSGSSGSSGSSADNGGSGGSNQYVSSGGGDSGNSGSGSSGSSTGSGSSGNGPSDTIIGPTDSSGDYASVNGSIYNSQPHNPFIQNQASFTVKFPPGVLASNISITGVKIGFGTQCGYTAVARAVPEPGSLPLLITGTAALGFLRRSRSR